ncbi:MAG: protease SohB [Myxococcota bacterium]|nr:protease SohB [Myxococcota bacterium]
MLEFFQGYASFLIEVVTLLIAFAIVLRLIRGGSSQQTPEGHLELRRLHTHFADLGHALSEATLDGKARKKNRKKRARAEKAAHKTQSDESRNRIFIIDFKGDVRASGNRSLRKEVSAIIAGHQAGDEVFVRLDSPGGTVTGYGLAASQLTRLKAAGIKLTVAVDQVAASGGYMMACVADHVLGAPFAIFGSIGVVTTIPNVNRLLKRNHVDVEMLTAGEFKRTLTVIGENTPEGRAKMQAQLEEIHVLFKAFIGQHRPSLELERVATGEYWQGETALDLGLIDEVGTSDDWLLKRYSDHDIIGVKWVPPKTVSGRLRNLMMAVMRGSTDATRQVEVDSQYI